MSQLVSEVRYESLTFIPISSILQTKRYNGEPLTGLRGGLKVLDPHDLIRIMPAEGTYCEAFISPSPAEGILLNQKRAIIFLNGQIPDLPTAMKVVQPGDWLVAVDGGLNNMYRLGFQPNVVIGDMDSVSADDVLQLTSAGVRLIRYPKDKDETDFELALSLVIEKEGFRTVRVVGALGGRIDQTLGNLALLALPMLEHCDVRLDDGCEEVFLIRSRMLIEGKPGDTVSLIPMFGVVHGIVTEGLQYPLRREALFPERTRGISNVMLGHWASVQIEQGLLLCVHMRQMNISS